MPLIDSDRVLLRGNTVGDYFQIARAGFHVGWYVQMCVSGAGIANRHAVVIVGAAIEDMPRALVGNAHDGVIGCVLEIIPVGAGLRGAVKPEAETG